MFAIQIDPNYGKKMITTDTCRQHCRGKRKKLQENQTANRNLEESERKWHVRKQEEDTSLACCSESHHPAPKQSDRCVKIETHTRWNVYWFSLKDVYTVDTANKTIGRLLFSRLIGWGGVCKLSVIFLNKIHKLSVTNINFVRQVDFVVSFSLHLMLSLTRCL